MDNAGARSVGGRFLAVINRQPVATGKSMTYDQFREMHGYKIVTERTGVQIYIAIPHSPRHRFLESSTCARPMVGTGQQRIKKLMTS